MTYVLVGSAALGGILLFLLAAATANSPLFAEHYPLLLGLNAAIALALLGLVAYQLAVLARQRRAKCSDRCLPSGCSSCLPSWASFPGSSSIPCRCSFSRRASNPGSTC